MIEKEVVVCPKFEYAGFYYEICWRSSDGRYTAVPLKMQHRAASKEAHRHAAVECYKDEYNVA